MDVTALESDLLAVRAGIAARAALTQGVPDQGAVPVFDVSVWDGRNAAADLLRCSFEPGAPLTPGVHELVRTGRCGGHDVTVSTWVVVGERPDALPEPTRLAFWRPDPNRRPIPDPDTEPAELPWLDALPAVVELPVLGRAELERVLRRLVSRGERALASLVAQFAPTVGATVARRRGVIDRNPAFDTDDARACVNAELVDQLLRFASEDRPNATVLRTLRFALPNRLDAALGTVDRAHTGSAENAEIRLFVRRHHELEPMPDHLRADGDTLERHLRTVATRIGLTDRRRALERIRHAEDAQWSITVSRARRAADARGEVLGADWEPVKHRFSVPHICEALAREFHVVSLDQPAGDDTDTSELHQVVAAAPDEGFADVEHRELVAEILTPASGFELEAAVWQLRAAGATFAEIAEQLHLADPEAARATARRWVADRAHQPSVADQVDQILAGTDLTELELEVFTLRSGIDGEQLAWSEVCRRTDIASRYRSATAAETRARSVLRRAERLVRGQAALALEPSPARRAELLCERAEALCERPFALAR